MIQAALDAAELSPSDIDYIEAHGTGTPLGDPIEVDALGRIFGDRKADAVPLALGSVKANIGHLEPAAGIAGLLKALLVVQRRHVPPHLHFKTLNPRINLSSGKLAIHPDGWRWPDPQRTLRAGISSFGLSGTNAHVILESAPVFDSGDTEAPNLLRLSAPSPEQLTAVAANVLEGLRRFSWRMFAKHSRSGRPSFRTASPSPCLNHRGQ